MHKDNTLNLVRGVAFLVFVCAGSFSFAIYLTKMQTEWKRNLSLSKKKNLEDATRNKQMKVRYRETKGLTMPRMRIVSLLHLLHFDKQKVFPLEESARNH